MEFKKQEELLVNQFEVEELEERLENKWGDRQRCLDGGGMWHAASGTCFDFEF